ncbi:MAG: hypothetical protein U1F20_04705 [Lysobacterales bacterium]
MNTNRAAQKVPGKIIDYRGKTPKKLSSDWADEGYRALSAISVKDSGLTSTEAIAAWMLRRIKSG